MSAALRAVAGLLAACACAAAALAASPASPDPRLAGRWEGLDAVGNCSGLVLEKNGTVAAFVSRGQLLIPASGRSARMLYATDARSNPARLDLILTDSAGNELERLLAIYRFPVSNQLELRTYFNDDRPLDWGPDPDARNVVLTRLTFANQALVCRVAERKPAAK